MNKEKFYSSLKGNHETKNKRLIRAVSSLRWNQAHVSEEDFWKEFNTETIEKNASKRNEIRAKLMLEEWSKYLKITKKTRILQIGCGPEDVINHFKTSLRYSIDPLADFYKNHFKFNYDSTHLMKADGENLPFKNNFFDIVILTNVLDHTHLPEKVLSEIHRVLKKNGIFHFENYFYQKSFLRIAYIWGFLKKLLKNEIYNIHHPYMFTVLDLKDLVNSAKFTVLSEEIGKDPGNYENIEEFVKIIKNQSKKSLRILSFFGLFGEINYLCVCKKVNL